MPVKSSALLARVPVSPRLKSSTCTRAFGLSLFYLRVCHPPSRARLPLLPEHVGTDGWRTGPSERTIKRTDAGEFFSFSLRNVAFRISALWRGTDAINVHLFHMRSFCVRITSCEARPEQHPFKPQVFPFTQTNVTARANSGHDLWFIHKSFLKQPDCNCDD